jgi:hypothetical protein
MTDTETNSVEFSGDGDERDDLSPGEDVSSELFDDVDEDYDYEAATETWIGEPATTELAIETVDGIDVKQFVLEEPDDPATMDAMLMAVLQNDKHAFCRELVREPELADSDGSPNGVWREKLTERERQLVFDLGFVWCRFQDFDTMAHAAQEVEQSLEQLRE